MSAGVSLTPKSGHERVVPMLPELEARLRDAHATADDLRAAIDMLGNK